MRLVRAIGLKKALVESGVGKILTRFTALIVVWLFDLFVPP